MLMTWDEDNDAVNDGNGNGDDDTDVTDDDDGCSECKEEARWNGKRSLEKSRVGVTSRIIFLQESQNCFLTTVLSSSHSMTLFSLSLC